MRVQANQSAKRAFCAVAAVSSLLLASTIATAFEQDPPITIDTNLPVAPTILNTSPLYSDSGSSYPACNLVNLSTVNINFQVDLINGSGALLYTSGTIPIQILPGAVREFTSSTNYTGYSRCRFTVYANPEKIRANLTVYHFTGVYYETLASDDAH